MKKIFMIGAIALACTFGQTANAQSFFKKLLKNAGNTAATTAAQGGDASTILNSVLGNAVTSATGDDGTTANLIGNIISKVTGNKLTTQANLVGSWTYSAPAVQFESENLLSQAGGTAVASKLETKLAKYYSVVGIKAGKMNFSFAEDGTCTYGVGSRSLTGTYVFDSTNKTVTITTTTGQAVKAYVTISGTTMALCFDGSKVLTLFNQISSKFSSLSTISTLAQSYSGMKCGFKFNKK